VRAPIAAATVVLSLVLSACSEGTPAAGPSPTRATPSPTPSAGSPTVAPLKIPSECPRPVVDLEVTAVTTHWTDERGHALEAGEACLAAPAVQPLSVTLHNDPDGEGFVTANHNFSLYVDASRTQELFTGDLVFPGDSVTYEIPALEAGAYLFACDIHPQEMTGVLVVE
jgi:plastocyanin